MTKLTQRITDSRLAEFIKTPAEADALEAYLFHGGPKPAVAKHLEPLFDGLVKAAREARNSITARQEAEEAERQGTKPKQVDSASNRFDKRHQAPKLPTDELSVKVDEDGTATWRNPQGITMERTFAFSVPHSDAFLPNQEPGIWFVRRNHGRRQWICRDEHRNGEDYVASNWSMVNGHKNGHRPMTPARQATMEKMQAAALARRRQEAKEKKAANTAPQPEMTFIDLPPQVDAMNRANQGPETPVLPPVPTPELDKLFQETPETTIQDVLKAAQRELEAATREKARALAQTEIYALELNRTKRNLSRVLARYLTSQEGIFSDDLQALKEELEDLKIDTRAPVVGYLELMIPISSWEKDFASGDFLNAAREEVEVMDVPGASSGTVAFVDDRRRGEIRIDFIPEQEA